MKTPRILAWGTSDSGHVKAVVVESGLCVRQRPGLSEALDRHEDDAQRLTGDLKCGRLSGH